MRAVQGRGGIDLRLLRGKCCQESLWACCAQFHFCVLLKCGYLSYRHVVVCSRPLPSQAVFHQSDSIAPIALHRLHDQEGLCRAISFCETEERYLSRFR